MENQFDNTLTNEMENQGKRPQFLSVLCILSFICCGLLLVMTLYGLVSNTPEKMQQSIEQMREISPATADQMEAQFQEQQNSTMAKIQPYISILFLLASFLGVMQMFNLKKMGFYIYTAAELIPYLFMIGGGKKAMAMMGSMGGGAMEMAAIAVLVIMVLFDVGFIIMYALNLKHMTK